MSAKKSTTKAFKPAKPNNKRICAMLESEREEHETLRSRLIQLADAFAEEMTISELDKLVAQWSRHPHARFMRTRAEIAPLLAARG